MTEPSDPSDPVSISPEDFASIVRLLHQIPASITQMAEAVQRLSENTHRTPSKSWTATITSISAVVIILILGIMSLNLRNQSLENHDLIVKVFDCIDFDKKGTPIGECAKRNTELTQARNEQLKFEMSCEHQALFREIFVENPQLGIKPPLLSAACERAGYG